MSDVVQTWLDPIGQIGGYIADQCTAFVKASLSWVPAGLGNAQDWLSNAAAQGFQTGSTPAVGSVAVWSGSQVGNAFGHVAEVVGLLPGGGIQVAEENWLNQGSGTADIRDVSGAQLPEGYIYAPSGATVPGLSGLNSLGSNIGNGLTSAVSSGIQTATADMLTQLGHGLAGATSATAANIGIWAKNNIVPLAVALVVALALFGGENS